MRSPLLVETVLIQRKSLCINGYKKLYPKYKFCSPYLQIFFPEGGAECRKIINLIIKVVFIVITNNGTVTCKILILLKRLHESYN